MQQSLPLNTLYTSGHYSTILDKALKRLNHVLDVVYKVLLPNKLMSYIESISGYPQSLNWTVKVVNYFFIKIGKVPCKGYIGFIRNKDIWVDL